MRRRLVDVGLAALGAAAVLGVVKALPLLAAFISYPTTWVDGQVLTAGDLNNQFAAVTAQVNGNLDDTNIAAGAAIKGSKLADAPNGVPTGKINDLAVTTAKINDLAVTSGKIAVNGTIHAIEGADVDPNMIITDNNEHDIVVLPAITTRGGYVLFGGDWSLFALCETPAQVVIRVYRTASVIHETVQDVGVAGGQPTDPNIIISQIQAFIPLVPPTVLAAATPGTYTYKVTVQKLSGTCDISGAGPTLSGQFYALEFS